MRHFNTCVLIAVAGWMKPAWANEGHPPSLPIQASVFSEVRLADDANLVFIEGLIEYESGNSVWSAGAEGEVDDFESVNGIESKMQLLSAISQELQISVGVRLDYVDEEIIEYAYGGAHLSLPFKFNLDAFYFLSEEKQSYSRWIISNEIELSSRWQLETALEYNISLQDDEEGIGGVTDGEFATRIKYNATSNISAHLGYLRQFESGDQYRLSSEMGLSTHYDKLVFGVSRSF